METLLDSSYTTVDEKPVIQLFYNRQKIKNVEGVEPYFYATSSNPEELKKEIEEQHISSILKIETIEKTIIRKKTPLVKITLQHPRNVPENRDKIRNLQNCEDIYEADIRFAQRYLIDSEILPMEGADKAGLVVASFDIETYATEGKIDTKSPILMISYADSTGMEKVISYKKSDKEFVETVKDEKEMLEAFVELVKKQKVDIIVGYNTDNFDFPYIQDRAKELKVKLDIGADGSELRLERRGIDMGARVTGRPHIDLYPVCRRLFKLPRYTLEDVYESIFGKQKLDIDTDKISVYWDGEKKEELDLLFQYSMEDAKGGLKIANEVLPLVYQLSSLIGQPPFEVSRMGTGTSVEWLLMKKAHENNVLVPNKPRDSEARERATHSFQGAYVLEPKKGIHEDIIVYDFRSLYPSIIMAHNIDSSTLNCDCCKKEDAHVAPTGAYFCKNKTGFIPEILGNILKARLETKKKLKEERSKSKPDEKKANILDARQQALKVLLNSAYGYLAFSRARWYSKDCATAVTAYGREYIKKTIKAAEKAGMKVIAGDTDSVFLTLPNGGKEKTINLGKEFAKKINAELPETMELEFEGYYVRGVFVTKKRYAMIGEDQKLTIKGLETRRRDWSNIAKTTQQKVLELVLWENNPRKAADYVREVIEKIKEGKILKKELAVYSQLTKNPSEYQSKAPHVEAVKKAMQEGKSFSSGDVFQYIITKKGEMISDKARLTEFVAEGDYDPDYYINNQVFPAVSRILGALGYSEDELKGLGKQMTLGSF